MPARIKRCGICGAEFECRAFLDCWCSKVHVSKERLRKLSKITSDCVCPKCLTEAKL